MKRIAIAGFQHETNTFAPSLAMYSEFEQADAWPGLLKNDEVIRDLSGLKVSIMGFVDASMAKGGYEMIPVLWCAAEPSSYVSNNVYLTPEAMDVSDDDPSNQLLGSSITYRIAIGPQQGRKVFMLQTLPDCGSENLPSISLGETAGFYFQAGFPCS